MGQVRSKFVVKYKAAGSRRPRGENPVNGDTMANPVLTPEIAVDGRVTVVTLGPGYRTLDEHILDAGLGESLLEIAAAANPPLLVLDLSQTTFFGSSFIEVLFRLWHRLHNRPGGTFAICGLTPHCLEVLKVTHLDTLWRLFADRSAAVTGLSSGDAAAGAAN